MATEAGMARWKGRVSLITGGSMGIGACLAKDLVKYGMTVIACARNVESVEALAKELESSKSPGKLVPYKCDITDDKAVETMFEFVEKNYGGADVLVNSAGMSYKESLLEMTPKMMREMLDLNVVALTFCTQKAVNSMLARGIDDGHVFNLNSMSGHRLTPILNFYSATKFAVTALTEGFRKELVEKSHIRITSVSPGLVKTDFLAKTFESEEMAGDVFARVDRVLVPQDISDIILFSLSSSPNVQIHEVMVRPCGERI